MKINCPECGKEYDIDKSNIGQKVECTCSFKFMIDENGNASEIDKGAPDNQSSEPYEKPRFDGEEIDFSRTICCRCGQRINTEDLDPGERFDCPFCQTNNVVGQNLSQEVNKQTRTTGATITDGGHAYSSEKSEDGSIPEIIGRCRITKFLGEGGMGRVYLARHTTLDIDVALKTMLPAFASGKVYADRFIREARTAAKMNHPNVVRVYDCGNENDLLYIVMEYVSGGNAEEMLDKKGRLPVDQVIDIAEAVAGALVEAQKFGIIHRDIKPENIMVTEDGVYKLGDLGLAKQLTGGGDSVDISLTMESTGLGTPLYMPPEQSIDAKSCDVRSDIYALGATLYHLLCGIPPFTGETQIKLFRQHSEEIPPSPSDINPEVPAGLETIIEKCMGKTPEERYQTPAEMLEDIKLLRSGGKIKALVPKKQQKAAIGAGGDQKEETTNKKWLKFVLPFLLILPLLILIFLFIDFFSKPKDKNNLDNDQSPIVEDKKPTNVLPNENSPKLIKKTGEIVDLPEKLRQDLVLFYNFNKVKGSKVSDLSGSLADGEISEAKVVSEPGFGKVLEFDGENDYVDCPLSSSTKGSLTLSAWIKSTQKDSAQRWIMSRSKWGPRAWQLVTHRGQAGVEFGPGGENLAKSIVTDGKWHHVLGCYDAEKNERRLYIDGKMEVFDKGKNQFKEDKGNVLLGIRSGSSDFYKGMMDNIMIYQRVLSPGEIKELAQIRNPGIKDFGNNRFKLIAKITTSNRRNSGTSSPVYILLNGEEKFRRRLPENPRSKATQTFEFEYDYPIDKIENVKVEIGGSNAWGVSNIAFQVVQGDRKSELKSVGGGYFSTGRESGAKAVKSKTYEFKPVFKSGKEKQGPPSTDNLLDKTKNLLNKNNFDIHIRDKDRETVLFAAIELKNRDLVELLIGLGTDVNAKNFKGETPLYKAIYKKDEELVKLLIENGADVNTLTNSNRSLLSLAKWWNHKKIASILESHGAKEKVEDIYKIKESQKTNVSKKKIAKWPKGFDINARVGDKGYSLLHQATREKEILLVEFLIAAGAEVNIKDYKDETPLHLCSKAGIAKVLIKAGADVNISDKEGKTPLHNIYDTQTAELLIKAGADVNALSKSGNSPLHIAAIRGRGELVELLIKKGADVNVKTRSESTPAHFAENRETIEVLAEAKADLESKNCNGETPLMEALSNHKTGKADFLLQKKPDLKIKDKDGNNLLYKAVKGLFGSAKKRPEQLDLIKRLIKKGVDVNAKNKSGHTPLYEASYWDENKDAAELLVKAGADVNADDLSLWGSPLRLATLRNQAEFVAFLLEKGADVNQASSFKKTALHIAVKEMDSSDAKKKESWKVLELLLANGADVNLKDTRRESPLDLAKKIKDEKVRDKVLEMLKNAGARKRK